MPFIQQTFIEDKVCYVQEIVHTLGIQRFGRGVSGGKTALTLIEWALPVEGIDLIYEITTYVIGVTMG